MQCLEWESYLEPAKVTVAAHRARSAATFAGQKENIRRLCRILRPRSVVCMGAGYLNDIPVDDLIAIDADLYLAEWIGGISEQAFHHDLVTQLAGRFVCLACKCSGDPTKFCKNYREEKRGLSSPEQAGQGGEHCDNFVDAGNDAVPLCCNYAPGEFPCFLHADVTQGVAEHFARRVPAMLRRANKPQKAFQFAVHASAHPQAGAPLPLAGGTADFITSSLVASQFDFEPYNFFVRNLFLRFGQEAVDRNLDALNRLVETLRDRLFLTQLEGHCREMLRLLKPGGRIYFSIEALHAERPGGPYFQSEVYAKAMDVIGRHFHFDLQTLPELMMPERAAMVEGGESVIHSYLLLPKQPATVS